MSFDNFPLQVSEGEAFSSESDSFSGTEHFGDNTVYQLENLWQNRLRQFCAAEKALQRAKRMMAIWLVVVVISLCMLCFSLFVSPVSPVWLFTLEFIAFFSGCVVQPVCYLLVKEQRRHRDALSKRFYQSNHEVEVTDSHLVLINRGNYSAVTRVPILER
ncbi:hypothetical protein Q4520_16650 [Alteromonas sp. 1_MG-2023]|uniref:hypothetical protein n=1 Tax=Alteromonas sp. 1_MG-2023 TaxID=3062669 RepID=UPI0026E4957B|nr:hypothetical protein [Alteromonas sp. 1_MG-2023]MDO6477056.1 hypothetical protein [Alteromonas sp. 1_MG-2023]